MRVADSASAGTVCNCASRANKVSNMCMAVAWLVPTIENCGSMEFGSARVAITSASPGTGAISGAPPQPPSHASMRSRLPRRESFKRHLHR